MAGNMPKRKIKDSVFTNLFQDRKYLLQLYKALHPEDQSVTEEEIADVTIKHVLVDADYNDLGFSVGNRLMVLVESQSTWTANIIVRALMYLMQTYHDYFKRTSQNLYGSRNVNMPRPELYVIFTGDRKDVPDSMSLSAEFFGGAEAAVNAEVKVIHRNDEKDIIGQYIIFSKVYDQQRKLHGNTMQAITETIRICKDRNVLKDYLESREQEVVDIMMTLFDDEQILKAYAKDIKESTEKDTARKTAIEMATETAVRMLKDGKLTLEEIVNYVPALSLEELKELETQVLQSV